MLTVLLYSSAKMLVTNIRVRTLLNCQRLRLQEHLPTKIKWLTVTVSQRWDCQRSNERLSAVSSAVVWRRSAMATRWCQMADHSKRELQRLRNWWTFGEVTGKMIDCFMRPIPLALLSSKMLISPDKVNNLCITDRNCYYNCWYVNRQISVSLWALNILRWFRCFCSCFLTKF